MLDTSALLAYLNGETGADKVPVNAGDAAMSTVNYAETVAVLTRRGMSAAEVRTILSSVLLNVVDFDRGMAEVAGFMIATTRPFGLSLGDRACLAAARSAGIPAMTADRSWSKLGIGVPIQLIR
jgi:PIN domain nuclease of toxin-antitoxin system